MKLKSIFFLFLFLTVGSAVAKENNLPIPVNVNESITVTLFFPSEIRKVIEPAVNYKFQYEQNGTMGTLMARKGLASNLTVITSDGSIFSFLLQYDQEVANFTYLLSVDQAIGTMRPSGMGAITSSLIEKEMEPSPKKETMAQPQNKETNVRKEYKNPTGLGESLEEEPIANRSGAEDSAAFKGQLVENNLYDTDREGYYDIFCENNYDQGPRFDEPLKAGTGIELQLNALTADKNEFYFILQVTNRLTSQFKAAELQFYVRTSLGDEPVQMTPLHVFNHQEYIEAGRTKKMVYVFEQFRLSEGQKVYTVLNESDGIRSTILKIESQMVNAAGARKVTHAR